jgi:hypothetical protein
MNHGKNENKQLATRYNCAEEFMKAGEISKIAKLGTAGNRNDTNATPQ